MSTNPIVKQISDIQVQATTKDIFEKMKSKSGEVPKWMRVMANCDDIFTGFFSLFKAVMDDKPLPSELKWKIAYIISEENKCEYCTSVSELQLKKFGMESIDSKDLHNISNDREKLAINYAIACNSHAYKIESELIEAVKKEFSDEELVELTSVVGLFNYINRFNDALGILPN